MLKPSKKSGSAPLVAEVHGRGHPKVMTKPNLPASTKNRVIVSEAKGNGKKSTFSAPRTEGESGLAKGYTKVG